MKKWGFVGGAIAVAALIACALLAPAAPASAHGGGRGWGGDGGFGLPFDRIPGVLDAQADEGILAAAGVLNVHVCADDGLLLVRNRGDITNNGTSTGEVEWLGLHVFFGFNGCVDATGSKAAALVVGQGLTLHAEGLGIAFLKGTGSYTNDGDTQDIPSDGVVVNIGSKLFGHKTKTPTPAASTPTATNTPGAEPTATETPAGP